MRSSALRRQDWEVASQLRIGVGGWAGLALGWGDKQYHHYGEKLLYPAHSRILSPY